MLCVWQPKKRGRKKNVPGASRLSPEVTRKLGEANLFYATGRFDEVPLTLKSFCKLFCESISMFSSISDLLEVLCYWFHCCFSHWLLWWWPGSRAIEGGCSISTKCSWFIPHSGPLVWCKGWSWEGSQLLYDCCPSHSQGHRALETTGFLVNVVFHFLCTFCCWLGSLFKCCSQVMSCNAFFLTVLPIAWIDMCGDELIQGARKFRSSDLLPE